MELVHHQMTINIFLQLSIIKETMSNLKECTSIARKEGTFGITRTNQLLDCSGQPLIYVDVESAVDTASPPVSGPVRLFNRDTLRFISPGNDVAVQPGSANVFSGIVSNIGKIWLTEFLSGKISGVATIAPEDWQVAYENFAANFGKVLLQGTHLFSIPSTYEFCVFVKVNVQFKVLVDTIGSFDVGGIALLKNGSLVSYACITGDSDELTVKSVHHHDIVPCTGGDVLDIALFNDSLGFDVFPSFVGDFIIGSEVLNGISYATFEFVGYDMAENCVQENPPPGSP